MTPEQSLKFTQEATRLQTSGSPDFVVRVEFIPASRGLKAVFIGSKKYSVKGTTAEIKRFCQDCKSRGLMRPDHPEIFSPSRGTSGYYVP